MMTSAPVVGAVPWSQLVPRFQSPLLARSQVNVVGTLRSSSSTSIGRTRRGRDGAGRPAETGTRTRRKKRLNMVGNLRFGGRRQRVGPAVVRGRHPGTCKNPSQ